MYKPIIVGGVFLAAATVIFAQQAQQRQASIRGGGNANEGKCTIEVFVDANAEVQIQGATGTLRTTGGQPAQWRRFECTSPMPANPQNFHFAGVDGRGRQDLIRDPRNGGSAVVQIEDRDGGAEGYTFDLTWGNNQGGVIQSRDVEPQRGNQPPVYQGQVQGPGQQPQRQAQVQRGNQGPGGYRDYADERYRPGYQNSDYYRRYGHGFAVDDAIRVCRDNIVLQAQQRFRNADLHIRRMDIDDAPGRNDWVLGSLDVHTGQRGQQFNFSCAVNFDNGRVRSAQIDAQPIRY